MNRLLPFMTGFSVLCLSLLTVLTAALISSPGLGIFGVFTFLLAATLMLSAMFAEILK